MIPHHVYYQLVMLVLLWLWLMLPHLWPSPPGVAHKIPTQSIQSKLDFIQLCGIAHRINEAFEQCAWNFYHVGLLW